MKLPWYHHQQHVKFNILSYPSCLPPGLNLFSIHVRKKACSWQHRKEHILTAGISTLTVARAVRYLFDGLFLCFRWLFQLETIDIHKD